MLIIARAAVLAASVAVAPAAMLAQSVPPGQSQLAQPSRLQSGQIRAMDFIERYVYSADGRELGEVADLIIEDNRVVSVIVELEGWLGLGERHVALPFDRIDHGVERLVTDMNQDELKELPEFSYQD